jgi:dihydroxyacetone kinase phosphotransfer subunit
VISLLIVSHSHAVAQGLCQLAQQMAPPDLIILAVGGLQEDDTHTLGTDVEAIVQAIHACWTPAGVLILGDLGSTIMGAETALEMIPPEMAARCRISNAPLVEGAVIAAIEAGLGHDLERVNAAAEAAAQLVKVAARQVSTAQEPLDKA